MRSADFKYTNLKKAYVNSIISDEIAGGIVDKYVVVIGELVEKLEKLK